MRANGAGKSVGGKKTGEAGLPVWNRETDLPFFEDCRWVQGAAPASRLRRSALPAGGWPALAQDVCCFPCAFPP